jgi:hypothetical protein
MKINNTCRERVETVRGPCSSMDVDHGWVREGRVSSFSHRTLSPKLRSDSPLIPIPTKTLVGATGGLVPPSHCGGFGERPGGRERVSEEVETRGGGRVGVLRERERVRERGWTFVVPASIVGGG